jgi:hypothetical protein
MLALARATLDVSVLGFALAILYYLHFSERQPPQRRDTIARLFYRIQKSGIGLLIAYPGFVILELWAPAIALGGIETILGYVRSLGLPEEHARVLAGLWIDAALIAGWTVEYSLQRNERNLPTPHATSL